MVDRTGDQSLHKPYPILFKCQLGSTTLEAAPPIPEAVDTLALAGWSIYFLRPKGSERRPRWFNTPTTGIGRVCNKPTPHHTTKTSLMLQ